MDYFTKWPEAYPLLNQEAITVAKVLVEEMVCRFGVPLESHSDQGRNFESLVFSEMCRILRIRKTWTTPPNPQSDGMVERFNRTIENQLAVFVKANQRDWDEHVPFLLMAYRTASHESTGFSPTRLMMGHELRTPIDLIYGRPPEEVVNWTEFANNLSESLKISHEFARENLETASLWMKRKYDIRAEATALEVGDAVWLYNPQRKKRISPKLSRPWTGLFHIIKKINDLVYRIQLGARGKPKVVHRALSRYMNNRSTNLT